MNVNGPRVLIRRLEDQSLTSKLIQVIQYEHSPSQFARILAVGSGRRLEDGSRVPIPLEVGQLVITKPFVGVELEHNDETCHMVMEDDVLAVCEV